MSRGRDKVARMKELSIQREAERNRIVSNVKSLRNNLTPHSLLNRFKSNARIEARQKTREAVALAKSKPGAAAAVGGLALAAILWTPVSNIYKRRQQRDNRMQQDSVTENDNSDDIDVENRI